MAIVYVRLVSIIYVVVGLRRDGRKQVRTCLPRPGRENLEDWKAVLRNLLERLGRVLRPSNNRCLGDADRRRRSERLPVFGRI